MRAALRSLLFAPGSFFEERALDGVEAFAVALVIAAVTTILVGAGLYTLSMAMTGTVTVDNPDRPSPEMCEQFNDTGMTTPSGCGEPAQIQRQAGTLVWRYASGQLPWLFVGLVFVWLAGGLVLHAGGWLAGGTGRVGQSLALAAYGAVPSLLATALSVAVLAVAVGQADLAAGNPDALLAQIRRLQSSPAFVAMTALQVAGVVWQAAIWRAGYVHVHDISQRAATALAGTVGVVTVALTLL